MRGSRIAMGVLAAFLFVIGGCIQGPYDPGRSTTYVKDGLYYCELHDRPLRVGLVPIEYGYIRFSKAYRELSITTFPNSCRYGSGGCTPDSASPRCEWMWHCPSCRHAEECWEKQPDTLKQEMRYASGCQQESLPKDVEAWAEFALRQTDDDQIDMCLQHLRFSTTQAKDWNAFRGTLAAYTRVAKKLEGGWPGFSGEIISISGKQHRRRTEGNLLEREYQMWPLFLYCFNPEICSDAYAAFAPAPEHRDLRDAWLISAIQNPFFESSCPSFEPKANTPATEPKTDASGNRYQQVSGLIRQIPARQIRVTRSDGSQFSFATFLIDDKVATVEEMIALCEKERCLRATDPDRYLFWGFWRP